MTPSYSIPQHSNTSQIKDFTETQDRSTWEKPQALPLPEHLDCVSCLVLLSAFQACSNTHQTGTCCNNPPVYGERHLVYAPLDFVLCLQVCHIFCWLSIYSQDHVSYTEVSLGSFTSGVDLQHITQTNVHLLFKNLFSKSIFCNQTLIPLLHCLPNTLDDLCYTDFIIYSAHKRSHLQRSCSLCRSVWEFPHGQTLWSKR